jgi:hypothetical protein
MPASLGQAFSAIMTTKEEIEKFLEIHQQTPVLTSPHALLADKRRIRTDKMRFRRLSAQSTAAYIEHAAADDTPRRAEANERLESRGFMSYRLLAPVMRRLFSDIWPRRH